MKLLLDTNALLWWFRNDPALGPAAREMIADDANEVVVSIVSMWEIVIKLRVGKLQADLAEVWARVRSNGFTLLQVEERHLSRLVSMPIHHRDPFDHMLIAQALEDGMPFVTADRVAALYGATIIPCSG